MSEQKTIKRNDKKGTLVPETDAAEGAAASVYMTFRRLIMHCVSRTTCVHERGMQNDVILLNWRRGKAHKAIGRRHRQGSNVADGQP